MDPETPATPPEQPAKKPRKKDTRKRSGRHQKSRAKPGAKRGRPRIPINEQRLRDLAALGATVEEMARRCHCSVDTLERRNYADIIADEDADLNISIRRAQIKLGVDKLNGPMLMHLGKNRLGQRDFIAQEHSGEVKITKHTFQVKRFT